MRLWHLWSITEPTLKHANHRNISTTVFAVISYIITLHMDSDNRRMTWALKSWIWTEGHSSNLNTYIPETEIKQIQDSIPLLSTPNWEISKFFRQIKMKKISQEGFFIYRCRLLNILLNPTGCQLVSRYLSDGWPWAQGLTDCYPSFIFDCHQVPKVLYCLCTLVQPKQSWIRSALVLSL